MWPFPRKKITLKASRTKSKGKSSLPQSLPHSKGESVAECNEHATFVLFGSTKDPAMEKTAAEPSASRIAGSSGIMQRTETGSRRRSNAPMKLGKDHTTVVDMSQLQAGDSGCEKGGTQKFPLNCSDDKGGDKS